MDLILRTANGDFDLFGSEDIVQTLGIFSFNDITTRSGEYTNVFSLPLTNNNRKLIEYADFIPSINTAPYKKIAVTLIVGGIDFKTGFLVIDSISDSIKSRFFSGNSNFYELLKSVYLTDLDWSDLNHTWNYTNAVASAANTGGYIYPVMDFGGQNLASDTVDVRKILPATFAKTAFNKIFQHTGYTVVTNFNDDDLNKSLLPYVNKNPTYPASYITLNSFEGSNIVDYGYNELLYIDYDTLNASNVYIDISPTLPFTFTVFPNYFIYDNKRISYTQAATGTGTYWSQLNNEYTSNANGVYAYDVVIDFKTINTHYSFESVITSDFGGGSPGQPALINNRVIVILWVNRSGVLSQLENNQVTTGVSWSGKVVLNAGDKLFITYKQVGTINFKCVTTGSSYPGKGVFGLRFFPEVDYTTNIFDLVLDPNLTFGNPITYSTMLPKMKCNDFLKDFCIRFGLILNINEDTKEVIVDKIDKLIENIPNSINWTNKLDESNLPDQSFKFDNYAQNNLFTHTEDKTVVNKQIGGDYNLIIDNSNLEANKIFYTSPFSECENIDFNGVVTSVIPTYNNSTTFFDKDVKPKILFSEPVFGLFKFTDGTSTSGYITTKRVYFIDLDVPDLSMGFQTSLMPKNSQTLISTLQNIRIVKANFNLNINDIKSIDWLTPVYIDQFQSYFFITSINQFNYTNPDLTEVELIKLNP